ncbi:MAG: hypothetical protein AAB695_02240 [Patescibacteria group bacterium]
MKNLLELLDRFSKVLNKNTETKNTIIRIIKEKTNIELKSNQINLKNDVLEIESSPTIKNEIKLKEDFLKQELKVSRILYK